MRGIQNNLANLQINQMAMEQAAIQAAKNQQPARARAETAEEILKQPEKSDADSKTVFPTDPNGKKKSNSQNFKNVLYSKDGIPQTNTDNQPNESTQISPTIHIDFKV